MVVTADSVSEPWRHDLIQDLPEPVELFALQEPAPFFLLVILHESPKVADILARR